MSKEPTFNDFREASPEELKRIYKMNARQLERAHRKHLSGASRKEYQENYYKLYRDNRGNPMPKRNPYKSNSGY